MTRQIRINRRSRSSIRRAATQFRLPELLEKRILLSAYVVNTTSDVPSADPSILTLRQAITDVNLDTSYDSITFNIPGTGTQTIALTSALPAITNMVAIDATSQPGFAGTPLIELNGANAGSSAIGLQLDAPYCLVRGLVIDRFGGDGIDITGVDGTSILQNYIGTSATGAETFDPTTLNPVQGNHGNGITVNNSSNTIIGGVVAAERNVISGNYNDGVAFININSSLTGNVLEGNYIGLDSTGTVAAGNQFNGVDLGTFNGLAVSGVVIGGTTAGAANVISANAGDGVYLNTSDTNTIAGNLIGTNAAGQAALNSSGVSTLGNAGDGITVDMGSFANMIGGSTVSARNVIAGSGGNGITISTGMISADNMIEGNFVGLDATGKADGNSGDGIRVVSGSVTIGAVGAGNVVSSNFGWGIALGAGGAHVMGNFIGTDAAGTQNLGNSQDGIYINSSMNVVGADASGAGNTIAFNGKAGTGAGVLVYSGTGNEIQGNSIFSNATLGIALGSDSAPVLNDSASGHAGPNLYQNFPVITSAVVTGSSVVLTGTLSASTLPNSTFVLDFFSNSAKDKSGYGQGQTYLGSATVTTSASGLATFSATFTGVSSSQTFFAATATDPAQNTSEFGADVSSAPVVVTKASTTTTVGSSMPVVAPGRAVTFTATITGAGGVPTGTVSFYEGKVLLQAVTLAAGSNVATFMTSSLKLGKHEIVAMYSGDSKHLASRGTVMETVSRLATATTLKSSASPAKEGERVTFMVSVTAPGAVPSGMVTFMDGATVIGHAMLSTTGNATLTPPHLELGHHSITAVYSGDGMCAGSQSSPFDQLVEARHPRHHWRRNSDKLN